MSLSFSTICERMRAHAVYMGEGLLFPPATEAEIQACEERLGFKLPPMMRELYMTVANGSDFFWWGYNYYTVSDDFARKHSNYPILGEIVGDGPRPFDDATVEALRAHPGAYVVCECIPAGFVDFASLGCEVFACLDGFTGHIYISDNHSTNGEPDGLAFSFGASSLEEWLERWFAEPSSGSSEGRYQPHIPLASVLAAESEDTPKEDAIPTQPDRQEGGKPTALKGGVSWEYSEAPRYQEHLRIGLERARAEVTQQLYDLDDVQRTYVESGVKYIRGFNWAAWLRETMRQLTDIEAQLDNMLIAL
jgi:SMI1/KNR4 family protein SUKH-1